MKLGTRFLTPARPDVQTTVAHGSDDTQKGAGVLAPNAPNARKTPKTPKTRNERNERKTCGLRCFWWSQGRAQSWIVSTISKARIGALNLAGTPGQPDFQQETTEGTEAFSASLFSLFAPVQIGCSSFRRQSRFMESALFLADLLPGQEPISVPLFLFNDL
jgi:hypothetical protein